MSRRFSDLALRTSLSGQKRQDKRNADPNACAFGYLCTLAKSQYCNLSSCSQILTEADVSWGVQIGRGAYASVAVCSLRRQNTVKLAAKQLKPIVAQDKVELKFFLLEAHIMSRLRHPCAILHLTLSLTRVSNSWDVWGLCVALLHPTAHAQLKRYS